MPYTSQHCAHRHNSVMLLVDLLIQYCIPYELAIGIVHLPTVTWKELTSFLSAFCHTAKDQEQKLNYLL